MRPPAWFWRVTVVMLVSAASLVFVAGPSASSPSVDTGEHGHLLPQGPIGHEGRWLTDATGRVLLLHGINDVNKTAPYFPSAAGLSDAYGKWLAQNGFRVVRVGILATGLMPQPGGIDDGYIAHIAQTVDMLARHGIYSLIDFHQDGFGPAVGDDGFPAWMTLTGDATNTHTTFPGYYVTNPAIQQAFQSFWDDAVGPDGRGLQEDYAAMWGAVAQRFATDPYVIGYDLFNEPWPGTTWVSCLTDPAGCPTEDNAELAPVYAKAVAAIRATGDRHLIFGEPFVLFNFGLSTTNIPNPGSDPASGLSFHMYTTDVTKEPAVLANAAAWSQLTGGALLNTEWGATTSSSDIDRQTGELDSALLPWIFWSIGEIVADQTQPPTSTNLIPSTVQSLVQPYPEAVAGTPVSYSYASATRELDFGWSTDSPDGRRIPPNTPPTVFEVPSTVFPNGYSVKVVGGFVKSKPCAPLLQVVPLKGATQVSVGISPAQAQSCPTHQSQPDQS
jgi:endoglycosylceramidase